MTRRGIEVGHSDPSLDPAGYRTLMVWHLAERYYRQPGLADRLAEYAGVATFDPSQPILVALLQAHELDYAWVYESVARQMDLRFLGLPEAIDSVLQPGRRPTPTA